MAMALPKKDNSEMDLKNMGRRIAEIDGTITFSSDQGTIIFITLPLEEKIS